MAAGSLLTLLDDIASVLDDVAVMTKLAAKKTAGVLGDDLALNAQQVSGVRAERELPVVWAVFKGSVINKLVLVPAALAISGIAPWLVIWLLMLGGLYLCFEGVEKVWHKIAHKKEVVQEKQALHEAFVESSASLLELEKQKIKGAIRTDFILSAEIIVIALGTVEQASFATQVLTVSAIAAIMTFGVYGLVACIVKLDDLGLLLAQAKNSGFKQRTGAAILAFCPWLMKALSFLGTAAMFLVGGGILVHGIPWLHHLLEHAQGAWATPGSLLLNLITGIVAGTVVVVVVTLGKKLTGMIRE